MSQVKLQTNLGDIVIELDVEKAPLSAANFLAYVRSGHVEMLLAQDVYGYGQRSVMHLVNKLHLKKNPASPQDVTPLIAVTKANVEEYAKNWEKWLPKK